MSLTGESEVGRQHCLPLRSIPTTFKKKLNVENTKLMNNKRSYFLTLHQRLGHPSEDITRATGLKLGLKMKGTMSDFEGCGLGKMRQKNVSKEQVPRAQNIGERMFIDISSIKHKSAGGAKFWALFMDDHSGFLINRFLREKSDLAR